MWNTRASLKRCLVLTGQLINKANPLQQECQEDRTEKLNNAQIPRNVKKSIAVYSNNNALEHLKKNVQK